VPHLDHGVRFVSCHADPDAEATSVEEILLLIPADATDSPTRAIGVVEAEGLASHLAAVTDAFRKVAVIAIFAGHCIARRRPRAISSPGGRVRIACTASGLVVTLFTLDAPLRSSFSPRRRLSAGGR
jgi:hypothetical protein